MKIRAGRIAGTIVLGMSLFLAIAGGMPQGKGSKGAGSPRGNSGNPGNAGNREAGKANRPTPGPPSNNASGPNNARGHQACMQACNAVHKQEQEACKVRTGPDRAACERAINERHRLCVTSCPKQN
jgi:hypothetical protein